MDWTELAQYRDRWRTLMDAVLNLQAPQNVGNFLTKWGLFSLWGKNLLHGAPFLVTFNGFVPMIEIINEYYAVLSPDN
jgi:hypothetical protein